MSRNICVRVHVNVKRLNKIKAMYGGLHVYVKVEPLTTFTFTHARLRDSGNPVIVTKISNPNLAIFISAPGQPIVTVQRLDSTSVRVSWKLNNGKKGIQYFLVTYHPVGRRSERLTKNTTKMELTVNGLEPDTEYEFVVSSISMVATGQKMVGRKKYFQGQGNAREFHFESAKSLKEIWEKWHFKSTYLFFSLHLHCYIF